MHQREVILTNLETGDRIVCDSIKSASKVVGCSSGQIAMALSRQGNSHGYKVEAGALHTVVQKNGKTNICFDCKKACGGCSWSEIDPKTKKPRFEPVPGWTAKPNTMVRYDAPDRREYMTTYEITECPLFERDEPRPRGGRALTDAESKSFLDNIESILRKWANE